MSLCPRAGGGLGVVREPKLKKTEAPACAGEQDQERVHWMSRIVITGASGNYGRGVTDRLIALGRASDLILITRKPEKLSDRAAQGCVVRYGDFDKPETLVEAVQGADRTMGRVSMRKPGFMPVPKTVAPCFFARASSFFAKSGDVR